MVYRQVFPSFLCPYYLPLYLHPTQPLPLTYTPPSPSPLSAPTSISPLSAPTSISPLSAPHPAPPLSAPHPATPLYLHPTQPLPLICTPPSHSPLSTPHPAPPTYLHPTQPLPLTWNSGSGYGVHEVRLHITIDIPQIQHTQTGREARYLRCGWINKRFVGEHEIVCDCGQEHFAADEEVLEA